MIVLGRGNLGRSLAQAFEAAGHHAKLLSSREVMEPAGGIVFLAVPDRAVRDTAERIARQDWPEAASFVHDSGALGLDALEPLSDHAVGSFHPLQSFPAPRTPDVFQGVTVAVDASTTALERRLAQLARDVGARPRHVGDAERPRYHAAAVFASNYVVAIVDEAVNVLAKAGWTRDEAEQALLPLVESVVKNMRTAGVSQALTGPIRRGDAETVTRHLQQLRGEEADLYRMLALITLEIARKAGLQPAAAGRIRRALTRDVAATRRRGRR